MTSLNLLVPIRGYVEKMTEEVPGLKVMLLDDDTSGMVSMVLSNSEIISKEVVLIESLRIFDNREEMQHLKCIVYVRPTEENISLLTRELRRPNYGEYHLYFSNIIPRDLLQRLAEADEREVVRRCEEYYGDIYVQAPHAFSLRISPTAVGERTTQGILSALLAVKRRPTAVRYQRNSTACQGLASSIAQTMSKELELFTFKHGACCLLIVDRWEDAVTPLLLPWTYQAMLHEYIGLDRNLVVLDKSETRSQKKVEDNEFVLSSLLDPFYAKQMYSNWGEICVATKELADTYQSTVSRKEELQKGGSSLDDVKALMQAMPDVVRVKGSVSKHLSLVLDIREKMRQRGGLIDVGQLEQDIACNQNHTEHWRQLVDVIASSAKSSPEDVVRVAMIYYLRYEKHPSFNLTRLCDLLSTIGISQSLIDRLSALKNRCSADNRQSTKLLFPEDNPMNPRGLLKIVKGAVMGMESEANVYAQHEPLLKTLVAQLGRGILSADLYPNVTGLPGQTPYTEKVREVIVFVVGGATYEEVATVHTINKGGATLAGSKTEIDVKVVLGSTEIINIERFMQMI